MKAKLLHTEACKVKDHDYKVEFWAGEVAQVHLVSYPVEAARTLAVTTKGYTGDYSNNIANLDMEQYLSDLKKTKLGTPAEMLNFVFLVRNVPRSWTHQAVRTRIGAAVVQESTRFIGAKDVYGVLVPKTAHTGNEIDYAYKEGNLAAIDAYERMLTHYGVASQDARNLLPHSMLTHMYWSLTLRALMGIYEVRWCCQAEPSTWLPVMIQMKELIIASCGLEIAAFLTAPIDRGENCGFNASFDRPCVWKQRTPNE